MYAHSQKQDRNTRSQFYHANNCNIISELCWTKQNNSIPILQICSDAKKFMICGSQINMGLSNTFEKSSLWQGWKKNVLCWQETEQLQKS